MTKRHQYLMVGEAPNARGQGRGLDLLFTAVALGRRYRSGLELRDFLRWVRDEEPCAWAFARRILHVNLLDEHPGRAGAGSAFPIAAGRRAAGSLLRALGAAHGGGTWDLASIDVSRHWLAGTGVLLLAGRRVASCFPEAPRDYFELGTILLDPNRGLDVEVAVVPHPSGVNRWWNEAGNRATAADFVRYMGSRG